MNMRSTDVRGRSFETVRRGYDPIEVDAFLATVADGIDAADAPTGSSQTAANQNGAAARDQLMVEAKQDIGRIRQMAQASAERTIRDASDEAQRSMIDARRDALALMERSRAEADAVVTEGRLEQAALEERIIELRRVVRRTEHLMKAMASGAMGDVAKAGTVLAAIEVEDQPVRVELDQSGNLRVDASLPAEDVTPAAGTSLPDSVDRLLDQLRDIG